MRKLLFFLAVACYGQITPSVVAPDPQQQWLNAQGKPYVGAFLCTFIAGSSTPTATYIDSTKTTTNTNPMVLDATGSATIWILPNFLYKYVLYVGGNGSCPGSGAVQWTRDFISTSSAGSVAFPVIVANGGTGDTTLPINQILLGNGTNPISSMPPALGNLGGASGSLTLTTSGVGVHDGWRFDIGGFPEAVAFGGNTNQGLVGSIKVPNNSTMLQNSGVAGYAWSGGGTSPGAAIGLFGQCNVGGPNGCWGANLVSTSYPPWDGTGAIPNNIFANNWGMEVDMNNSPNGPAPGNMWGIAIETAAYQMPVGEYTAFTSEMANVPVGGFQPFKIGFYSAPGSSQVAFRAAPVDLSANTSASQPIQWQARDSGGTVRLGQIVMTPTGDTSVETHPNTNLFLGDTVGTGFAQFSAVRNMQLSPMQPATVARASLPASTVAEMVYCPDCGINATSCPAGTGAWAFYAPVLSAWKCPF